jgi:hypothetical protein
MRITCRDYNATFKRKLEYFLWSALWLRIASDYQLACNVLWLAVTCVVNVPMQTRLILAYSSIVKSYYYYYYYYYYYASTALLLGLGHFFSFLILHTIGRTLWTGDQPVAMPLPTHRTTQTQNKRTQTSMPWVGFEPTIPAFERAKTFHALDRAANVIGEK